MCLSWCAVKPGVSLVTCRDLLTMIKGLPLAYNKDFQEDKEALFDAWCAPRLRLCWRPWRSCWKKASASRVLNGSMKQAVASDFSNATDVADYLVARECAISARPINWWVAVVRSCASRRGVLLRDLAA